MHIDHIYPGDCREILPMLPEKSVDLIFADPPYNLQLRNELWRPNMTKVDAVDDEWDRFPDFEAYDRFTCEWLTECKRVLKDTGTLWVIGSYHNIYRVGTILQNLGYWILNDVVWIKCLAGTTELYCLINDRPIVTNLKDLVRLDPSTNSIKLPTSDDNGKFIWTDIVGMAQAQKTHGVRIILEDGSWVECTNQHKFPVIKDGNVEDIEAAKLTDSDTLLQLRKFDLPHTIPCDGIDYEARPILFGDLQPVKIKQILPGTLRQFYDVAVTGNHLFALANGLLTHNSNPMPQFRGVRFTNAHETLLWCKKSATQKKYTFNYHAMKSINHDKQMRSDWELALATGSERLRVNGEKVHTTQKPEALLYRVILSSSNPGDVVLDPFFGTGTTGAVAKKLGRHYIGIEKEQAYIRAAMQRLDDIPPRLFDDEVFGKSATKRSSPRLPFSALIEQGLLLPGQTVYFDRDKNTLATILADGSLRTPDGARGSIHKLGAAVAKLPACNGWEHWYFENDDGELVVIDALREAVRKTNDER